MKKALWVSLLMWAAGNALPGYAEGNGHDLLRQCTQAANSVDSAMDPNAINFMDAGKCMGQVNGFAGAAAFYESQEGAPGAICFPENGATVRQSVQMVKRYLEDNPDMLHESSTVLIFGAFLSNYPCQ